MMNGRELEARISAVATEDTEVMVSSMDGGEWPVQGMALEWREDHYAAVMKPGARWLPPRPGDAVRIDEKGHVMVPEHMAAALRSVIPRVGSIWHWEPMKSHASMRVVVTDTRVRDGEVEIESRRPPCVGVGGWGPKVWNTLGRWMEAAVLVESGEE